MAAELDETPPAPRADGPVEDPAHPPAPARIGPVTEGAAATALHLASLAVAGALLLRLNRNQWFFGDEWEFLVNRRSGLGRALFAPHNEHWSTVPVLIYRALYGAFGLRSYLPYVAVLVVLHLTAVHLAWRLMNRAGVAPLVATALAAVFAVLGAGSENLLWAFQIGFVGSLALGLLHLALVDHPGPFDRRDRLAWLVAVVGLTFSGMTVTMVVVSGLVVLLRRGARDAVRTVAVPATAYLVWLVAIGHEGLGRQGGGGASAVPELPGYVWTGLTSALEQAGGLPAAGAVLVLVLLTASLLLPRGRGVPRPGALAVGMAAGAACLFVVTGLGRSASDIGARQATAGRYAYAAVAMLLPALGLLLSRVSGRRPLRQAAVAAVLLLPLVHNIDLLRTASHAEADREQATRRQIAAAAELVDRGAPLAATQPEPLYDPDLTVDSLQAIRGEGALPARVAIGERDRLAAAAALQVAITATAPTPGGPPPAIAGGGVAVDDSGCASLAAPSAGSAVLSSAGPYAVELRSSAGGPLVVAVHSATEAGVTSPDRTLVLRPGAAEWLVVAAPARLAFSVPEQGRTRVCGVVSGTTGRP